MKTLLEKCETERIDFLFFMSVTKLLIIHLVIIGIDGFYLIESHLFNQVSEQKSGPYF